MLTSRNIQVLRALRDIQHESGGYPPTVREIAAQLRMQSPSTVQKHIDRLVAHGAVQRRGNRRIVTEFGQAVLDRRLVA